MKTKIKTLIFFISLFILSSCGNWIDPNLNIDPTGPKDASMNAILPTAEMGIAYVLGGDINRYTSLFTQHNQGTDRQTVAMYNYNLTVSDLDNAWNTMYAGPMQDLYIIMNKAKASGSPHYQGIAEVLMALSLGMWTDILGDIPYTEAFQGDKNFKPKYDTQQSIYDNIQKLLDSAIANLSASKSNFKPGADDFIYGGDVTLWIKAAYTLKARYYLHTKNYTDALTALGNGFASYGEDFQFRFGNSETTSNPYYQYMTQRGDISMGPELMALMGDVIDPRIVPFTGDTIYSTDAYPSPFYASPNSPVPFISYVEGKFIEAECQLKAGNSAGAYTAYTDAITASCDYFGVSAGSAALLANPKVGVGANNLTLENIITQKYVAMYYQSETWSDWRRTGFPKLTPISGGAIPRRFIHPQSESLYNSVNLGASTDYSISPDFIFTKVWWDKMWP